jgi:hypothetical protein
MPYSKETPYGLRVTQKQGTKDHWFVSRDLRERFVKEMKKMGYDVRKMGD